jgi:hypothetical protein
VGGLIEETSNEQQYAVSQDKVGFQEQRSRQAVLNVTIQGTAFGADLETFKQAAIAPLREIPSVTPPWRGH